MLLFVVCCELFAVVVFVGVHCQWLIAGCCLCWWPLLRLLVGSRPCLLWVVCRLCFFWRGVMMLLFVV